MDEVKIRIYRIYKDESKELYSNSVKIPNGESFPFDDFTRLFRMLFPECLIQYSIF